MEESESSTGRRCSTVLFFDPQQLLQNVRRQPATISEEDAPGPRGNDAENGESHRHDLLDLEAAAAHNRSTTPRSRGNSIDFGISDQIKRRKGDDEFIKVAIRIRPFLPRDGDQKDVLTVDADGDTVTLDLLANHDPRDGDVVSKSFKYDYVLDSRFGSEPNPEYADQAMIYKTLGERVVKSALGGYNSCLFAYGQTGTGKTHTVLGQSHTGKTDQRGLLPRILEAIFSVAEGNAGLPASPRMVAVSPNVGAIPRVATVGGKALVPPQKDDTAEAFAEKAETRKYTVRISYLEIYNEQIHDLLVPPKAGKDRSLQVRYHPGFGVVINDLTEAVVTTLNEAVDLVDFGTKMRSIASTSMNSRSSRAHTVFTFRFEMTHKGGSANGESQIAQVQLVDLAGREQEKTSGDARERLRERAFINKSLFHLSSCITSLARNAGKASSKHQDWCFRNSRLTLLLAHSLTGNSRTGMVAAVSPAASDADETLTTLRFAASVKTLKVTVSINRVNKGNVLTELQQEISRLKTEMRRRATIMQHSPAAAAVEQIDQLESVCENFREQLGQEKERSKLMADQRAEYLQQLGLSVGKEGVSVSVGGADSTVPYLVNLSEDPYLQGCLMYFIMTDQEDVSVGSEETNVIQFTGLGIERRHCTIRNEENKRLFLKMMVLKPAPPAAQASSQDARRRTRDQLPRAFLNGKRVTEETEMKHQDRLILGHAFALKVVVPLSAAKLKLRQTQAGQTAVMDTDASLEQALDEIEDLTSNAFQHLRKYVDDLRLRVGDDAASAFIQEVHRSAPLVDEANRITKEVRPGSIQFQLQVLTDLWSPDTNTPEFVVAVLQKSLGSSTSSPLRKSSDKSPFCVGGLASTASQKGGAGSGNGNMGRFSLKDGSVSTRLGGGGVSSRPQNRKGGPLPGGGLWEEGRLERGTLKFVWSWHKFNDRLQAFRDIYEEFQQTSFEGVQRRLEQEPYSDPWKEIGSAEVTMLLEGANNQVNSGGQSSNTSAALENSWRHDSNGESMMSPRTSNKMADDLIARSNALIATASAKLGDGSWLLGKQSRTVAPQSFTEADGIDEEKAGDNQFGTAEERESEEVEAPSRRDSSRSVPDSMDGVSESAFSLDAGLEGAVVQMECQVQENMEKLARWYNIGRRMSSQLSGRKLEELLGVLETGRRASVSSQEGQDKSDDFLRCLDEDGCSSPRSASCDDSSAVCSPTHAESECWYNGALDPTTSELLTTEKPPPPLFSEPFPKGSTSMSDALQRMQQQGPATGGACTTANLSPGALGTIAEVERKLLRRESKLRIWAEQLRRKEHTLQQIETIGAQLRSLEHMHLESKGETIRTVPVAVPFVPAAIAGGRLATLNAPGS